MDVKHIGLFKGNQLKNEELSPLLQYNFIVGNKKIDVWVEWKILKMIVKEYNIKLNSLLEKNNIPKRIQYVDIKINKSNCRSRI